MRTLLPCLAVAFAASVVTAQTLVLPDNHNLMESNVYGSNAGDSLQWSGTSAKRFQVLYEASHFTGKAGIPPGGVLITRVQFRGEDGECNAGGQTYSGVTIEVGSTSLTNATMSTTFATNRLAATTTMGPLGTVPTLVVTPSVGSCPNNYCIDIDLVAIGAAFVFDPYGNQPNLLIDITAPTAPTQVPPQSMIPIQDTIAHGAGVRGRSIYTSVPTSTTGTSDTTPPVVGIEFAGPGGWPTVMPARAEYIGGGCGGSHATIYQSFQQDQLFDLGGGLTFYPDVYPSPNTYTVVTGAPGIDLSQLVATPTQTLDTLVTHPLGFLVTPFGYPGGTTSTIKPCTNGYVWLDAAMTDGAQYNPTRLKLLGNTATTPNTARFMPFWTDGDPTVNTTNTTRGLHVRTVPETAPGAGNAICYITWHDLGTYKSVTASGHASWTYQMVIHELTGIVEFRYGSMMPYASTKWTASMEETVVVGFTRGRIGTVNSLDPQPRDLSHELPYVTAVEGTASNVSLTGVATPIAGSVHQTGRMFGGQTLKWNIANIPVGTIIAWTVLDVGASQPGVPLGLFGFAPPGCMLSTTLSPIMLPFEQFLSPASTATGVATLVVPHGWEGTVITAQAVGIDVFGGPFLIPWTSNAIKYTVGLD